MTCNVWVGSADPLDGYYALAWPARLQKQARRWLAEDPDVICLQEVFLPCQYAVLSNIPGYTLFAPRRQPIKWSGACIFAIWILLLCLLPVVAMPHPLILIAAFIIALAVLDLHAITNCMLATNAGTCILVRDTIKVIKQSDHVFANQQGDSANLGIYRGYMSIVVANDTGDGTTSNDSTAKTTTTQIITGHFNQNHSCHRMQQIQEFLQAVDQADVHVLCGDFNAVPDSPEIDTIIQHGYTRHENDITTWNNKSILDHVFTDGDITSSQVLPLVAQLSDHSPIVVNVEKKSSS